MQNASTVKELVQISRDGLRFYQDAIKEVDDLQLKGVFSRMASNKQTLIDSLSTKLATNQEEVPTDGTLAGSLRKTYTDVRAALGSNDDKVYVGQLEQAEDRLMKHFEEALNEAEDPSVRSLLQSHFPQVRACHDEMRDLKRKLNA